MKMGSALEIFSSLLAKFLEWPVDQNVVSQLRTWHFPPPSPSNGGWRNNHIKYQEKNPERKPFFTLSPPPEVCLCLFSDWKIPTAGLKVSLAVFMSRFELFNIFPARLGNWAIFWRKYTELLEWQSLLVYYTKRVSSLCFPHVVLRRHANTWSHRLEIYKYSVA